MKQLQRLPIEFIYERFRQDIPVGAHALAFRHDIGVVVGINSFFFHNFTALDSPFLLDDYRMGRVARGRIRGIFNLQERELTEGMMAFITPGTIVEPLEVSDDFLLEGVGLTAEKFQLIHNGHVPEAFNGQVRNGFRMGSAAECALIDEMLQTLLRQMEAGVCEATIYNMVAAITHYFNQLFLPTLTSSPASRSTDIFARFLRLVNLHGRHEHQLAFYAGQLCITERYLSTVVRQSSGVCAKEWLDRAIIAAAKVMLRHTDQPVARIADDLRFPNASFFSKYFKRLTNCTPLEYRTGE